MEQILSKCILCPRYCQADRIENNRGYCGQSAKVKVARASLHMWEEPCISGTRGSGTVFFSGCPLKCVYCQNRSIALGSKGKELTTIQLSDLFLLLQNKGAHNINLVTPTQFVPQIAHALRQAKKEGLRIPVVYNTSSYERVETLALLDGLIDIYLPDLKYYGSEISARYSNAPDYFEQASLAIAEMVHQVGEPEFDNGLMSRGVIIRHMILPGCTKDSKEVIRYLYETYGNCVYLSIMNQYTPPANMQNYPEISRKITQREYGKVIDYAIDLGVEHAFIQEGGTALESFIPDFDDDVFLNQIV